MDKCTKHLVLTAFCFYMFTVRTYATEFLSINCGAAKGYKDDLGIEWVTDEDFIATGTSLQLVDAEFPLASLRYFEERRRKNCYVLPVWNRTTYLLRASFDPGNATSGPAIESPVDFNITVNNNLWFSYSSPSNDSRPAGWIESIVHTFDKNELFVCLLKGTQGYPFINSLELREQNSSSYVQAKKTFLIYYARYNTGTKPDVDTVVRYPDDIYDRIWFPTPTTDFPAFPTFENVSVVPPSTSSEAGDGYNWPPVKILQDAWVGRDLSSGNFPKPEGVKELFVAFYVMEIRSVNLTFFGELTDPVGMILGVNNKIYELNVTNIFDYTLPWTVDVESDSFFNVTVTSQPWSEQEAILNGFEIHESHLLDKSATYPKDRTAVKALQKSFDLEDWTGDPCFPVPWDWLTCDPKTSRIIKLELSNMNISGSIPADISKMAELTEIHLDNNNLTGSVPESITLLTKLEVLTLDNNKLSGQIPDELWNKTGFTFSGNSGLCQPGNKTCETTAQAPAPVAIPSAAVQASINTIYQNILIGVILALSVTSLAWN